MEPKLTSDQKLFHKATYAKGGLAHPSATERIWGFTKKSFTEMYEEIHHRHPTMPHIYFDFINSDALNACAEKYEQRYIIGLNAASCYLLLDVFGKMLSNRNVLTIVGDAFAESEVEKKIDFHYSAEGIWLDSASKTTFSAPNDTLRNWYCSLCAAFSYNYIMLHEFGHIVRGHLAYLNTIEASFIQEFGQPKSTSMVPPVIRQALEVNADLFALHFAVSRADYIITNKLRPVEGPNVYESWEAFIFCYIFSIYITFRLRFVRPVNPESAKVCTHPPPQTRIVIITEVLENILLENRVFGDTDTKVAKHKVSRLFDQAIREAEIAFNVVTFQNEDRRFQAGAHDSEIPLFYYKDNILESLENLYPTLQPFAFCDFAKGI